MRKLLLILILLSSGCSFFKKGTPDRVTSNQLAETVSGTRSDLTDKAAGNNAAIEHTAQTLPPSRTKDVILMFTEDQRGLLGEPKFETKASFLKIADQLLSENLTDRAKGEDARKNLVTHNEELKTRLDKQEKDFKAARDKEESDHKAELDRVREEGKAAQNRLISYIFFGGALLLGAGGVIVIMTAAQNPLFGPKVGFGLLAAAAASGLMGVLVLQLMKQLDEHPWILWTGGGIITLLLVAAGALSYANHQHHLESTKNGNS